LDFAARMNDVVRGTGRVEKCKKLVLRGDEPPANLQAAER
jgi:hypothetical protein